MTAVSAYKYSAPARLLHWIVAAAVVVQIALGWAAEWTADRTISFGYLRNHFQLGAVIFALMLLRLLWRAARGAPPPIPGEPRWRVRAAAAVHAALYILLLTMPLSGYVIWVWMDAPTDVIGLFEVPRVFTPPAEDETWRANAWYIHTYSGWVVLALIAVHIGAALWHELVLHDRLIRRRML